MENSQDIMFSQYAQDPLEGFSQRFPMIPPVTTPMTINETKREKRHKKKRDLTQRKKRVLSKSFVISKESRGSKLIQIKIIDLSTPSIPTAYCESECDDEDRTSVSAQYVVKEPYDEILDLTNNIIKKISKRLSDDVLLP